jgi:hypothetical protein
MTRFDRIIFWATVSVANLGLVPFYVGVIWLLALGCRLEGVIRWRLGLAHPLTPSQRRRRAGRRGQKPAGTGAAQIVDNSGPRCG